jgi:tetratricopeptide (TPR) repeat protein
LVLGSSTLRLPTANWKLLSIVLLALAWRLLLWAQPLHQPANDEVEYIRVARDLLAGRGWVFYESYHWLRAPLYPLWLAASLWLAGGDLHRAALPNIALSVANVALIYMITRELLRADQPQKFNAETQRRRDAETQHAARSTQHDVPSEIVNRQSACPEAPPEPVEGLVEGSISNLQSPISNFPLLAAAIAAMLQTYATFASLYMAETLFAFLFASSVLLLLRWRNARIENAELRMQKLTPSSRLVQFSILNSQFSTLCLAGICYGLAALTRSLPLAFLPVVLLWIVWQTYATRETTGDRRPETEAAQTPLMGEGRPARAGTTQFAARSTRWSCSMLIPTILFTICVFLPILPWTARNCQAYGRCILIETGLSYNLWAFSEPREDQQTIFRILESIPNPAERADEATRRGLERLQEDPAIMLRKIQPNWIALWAVKPIQDRFLLASYYADAPPILFLSALVIDDLLYMLVALAAVFWLGRSLARGIPAAVLPALWLLYVVAISLVTHGEGRYRHFFFMLLIPCAALALGELRLLLQGGRKRPAANPPNMLLQRLRVPIYAATLIFALLIIYPVRYWYYPWEWATSGAARSVHRLAGDLALARGDSAGAEASYMQALEASNTPDGWIILGDLYRREGRVEEAERAYRFAWGRARPYIAASARLGDMRRELGQLEEARTAFIGTFVAEQDVLDWSWQHLRPRPIAQVDVGDGLDFGYVGGMYPAETQQGATARWTTGHGLLRLTPTEPARGLLTLRLAAPHPNEENVSAEICVGERCQRLTVGRTWRIFQLALPPGTPANSQIELRSPTFTAPDGRTLGLLVDWAELR